MGSSLFRLSVLASCSWLLACGGTPAPAPADPSRPTEAQDGIEMGPGKWGTFRSRRHGLVLRLPGGSEWRVDDRSTADLVAVHLPTRSKIVAQRWSETALMTRASCEARARDRKLLPPPAAMVVEDVGGIRPGGEDVRIWVALEPGASPEAPIRGHVSLVGAQLKKCWAVHYATEVASAKEDVELSSRLALVREGTIDRVQAVDARNVDPRETRR